MIAINIRQNKVKHETFIWCNIAIIASKTAVSSHNSCTLHYYYTVTLPQFCISFVWLLISFLSYNVTGFLFEMSFSYTFLKMLNLSFLSHWNTLPFTVSESGDMCCLETQLTNDTTFVGITIHDKQKCCCLGAPIGNNKITFIPLYDIICFSQTALRVREQTDTCCCKFYKNKLSELLFTLILYFYTLLLYANSCLVCFFLLMNLRKNL